MNKISALVAALLLSASMTTYAQNEPRAAVVTSSTPGYAAVGEAVQFQGKIKSINKKDRSILILGGGGNEVTMVLGEEARNFKQLRVGDLVTLTYVQALALELKKIDKQPVGERVVSEKMVRAKPGEKPAGEIERTVQVVADVLAVNMTTKTVTARGPKRAVELVVNDPAQLKEIKVGDQIEASYTESISIEVTKAKSK